MSQENQDTTIRVLVVDDSFFMRKILKEILEEDPEIDVVGEARDGVEAIGEAIRLEPDVITMDYNMPRMNGSEAVENILKGKKDRPAIIMISATTREGAEETLASLRAGAVDYIVKPSGELSLDIEKIKDEIISKIKIASRTNVQRFRKLPLKKLKKRTLDKGALKFIAIGSSTGGPPVVEDILSNMPEDLDAAILINQHMPANFTRSFGERLNNLSDLEVHEAVDGEEVKNGMALIAPGGFHMTLVSRKENGVLKKFIKLTIDPPVNNFRPSVDVMMRSVAANECQNVCVGIILTGMGEDGREGIRAIKNAGGHIIAQSPETSTVSSMPLSIIKAGLADNVLNPNEISKMILNLVNKKV